VRGIFAPSQHRHGKCGETQKCGKKTNKSSPFGDRDHREPHPRTSVDYPKRKNKRISRSWENQFRRGGKGQRKSLTPYKKQKTTGNIGGREKGLSHLGGKKAFNYRGRKNGQGGLEVERDVVSEQDTKPDRARGLTGLRNGGEEKKCHRLVELWPKQTRGRRKPSRCCRLKMGIDISRRQGFKRGGESPKQKTCGNWCPFFHRRVHGPSCYGGGESKRENGKKCDPQT